MAAPSDSALQAEFLAYERLKPSLARLWRDVFSREDEPYTAVVVPSVTLERRELERHADALCWEETLLFLLNSPHGESGVLCYGLGALSEFGRVGLVAVGGSRGEAEQVFASAAAVVDAASAG